MSNNRRIPFNKPAFVGREQSYIAESVGNGHLSGDGPFTKRCHQLLEETFGIPKVLLTTSCTHALEMSAILLDLQAGDEVIVPSFTFVSTANAFALRGAQIIFADIRPDTLNLDERQLERLITPRTKAIVPVHYAGVSCEMDSISAIAAERGIHIVEDNAHGLFAKYKGKYLGTFGTLATQSFHETKNFQCGEGGALLINSPELMERAEIIREKGTNRCRFFRGQVDKYSWVDLGSSYLPSDMLAAVLFGQLEMAETIQSRRGAIWQRYYKQLKDWAQDVGVTLPFIPEHCEQPYHMFYMLMPSLELRQQFIQHMKANGVMAVYHYIPLHSSTMGATFSGQGSNCPVTESISDRLVRLPFYFELSEDDQAYVIDCIRQFDIRHHQQCAVAQTIS